MAVAHEICPKRNICKARLGAKGLKGQANSIQASPQIRAISWPS
jgi:hypothetical protein